MNYKGYHHLKWEDRLKIEGALKTGGKPAEIAEMLGVCVKTCLLYTSPSPRD